MLKISRNIAPFILIPLMLFSSIGFSIDIHYCQDEVKSIGFFNATPCELDQKMDEAVDLSRLPRCHRKKLEKEKNNKPKEGYNVDTCCHNKRLIFSNTAEITNVVAADFSINQVDVVLFYAAVNLCLISTNIPPVFYKNYVPPLLDRDISVLQQVFRI